MHQVQTPIFVNDCPDNDGRVIAVPVQNTLEQVALVGPGPRRRNATIRQLGPDRHSETRSATS